MTGDELVQALIVDTGAQFKPWSDDPDWPYLSDASNAAGVINAGRYTYETYKAGFVKQLDLFKGDAYGAFVSSHDGGQCVRRYLRFGDSALLHPEPPDNRYAPQDNGLQLSFATRMLNPYGDPMDDFHLQEGSVKWAAFASNPPVNAYGVFPDTAQWLCLMDLIQGDFRSATTWEAYRGKTIVDCMQFLKLGYPQ